jgi:signal transduction histidine kinase
MMTDNPNKTTLDLNFRTVLNSFGDGVLIFDAAGSLVFENTAIQKILLTNLDLVRSQGWSAFAALVDIGHEIDEAYASNLRTKALSLPDPVKFTMLFSEEHLPCWASRVQSSDGQFLTMITVARPDWAFFSNLMNRFREEAETAIDDTRGHAELILQIANKRNKIKTVDQMAERVVGFANMMSLQMRRLHNFIELLHRLEEIRTGQMQKEAQVQAKKIKLSEFIEDYLEEIADKPVHDTPKEEKDVRDRIEISIPSGLSVKASAKYLTFILRDVLKNALMYSPAGSPIKIQAMSTSQGRSIQLDIIDQGYGIRDKEAERVFKPFLRARQPQVVAEFGYGLSMYLAKANVEAMGGKMWFKSQEGVSTTFSIILPVYQE